MFVTLSAMTSLSCGTKQKGGVVLAFRFAASMWLAGSMVAMLTCTFFCVTNTTLSEPRTPIDV